MVLESLDLLFSLSGWAVSLFVCVIAIDLAAGNLGWNCIARQALEVQYCTIVIIIGNGKANSYTRRLPWDEQCPDSRWPDGERE
jgi:hypothetical protein